MGSGIWFIVFIVLVQIVVVAVNIVHTILDGIGMVAAYLAKKEATPHGAP